MIPTYTHRIDAITKNLCDIMSAPWADFTREVPDRPLLNNTLASRRWLAGAQAHARSLTCVLLDAPSSHHTRGSINILPPLHVHDAFMFFREDIWLLHRIKPLAIWLHPQGFSFHGFSLPDSYLPDFYLPDSHFLDSYLPDSHFPDSHCRFRIR